MRTTGKKAVIGSLTAAVVVLAASMAFAHGGRHGGDGAGFPGMYSGRLLDRLGATGEQKTQIQAVLAKHRPEAEPLVRQMVAERRALRRMIQDGSADEKAIRSQAAKVASLESDLAVVRARTAKEVRALLTPEQTAKLAELQAEREKKAGHWMERRFRGGERETR
jgi:protein CpxP